MRGLCRVVGGCVEQGRLLAEVHALDIAGVEHLGLRCNVALTEEADRELGAPILQALRGHTAFIRLGRLLYPLLPFSDPVRRSPPLGANYTGPLLDSQNMELNCRRIFFPPLSATGRPIPGVCGKWWG